MLCPIVFNQQRTQRKLLDPQDLLINSANNINSQYFIKNMLSTLWVILKSRLTLENLCFRVHKKNPI